MILTLTGTTFRAEQPGRRRLLASATLLLAITAGAIGARILLASNIRAKAPTLDILQKLFGLRGEDIDDAVLYEVWGGTLARMCARGRVGPGLPPGDAPVPKPPGLWRVSVGHHGRAAGSGRPWDAATVLIWFVGWAALTGAGLDGHRTAAFLQRANHVTGAIAD